MSFNKYKQASMARNAAQIEEAATKHASVSPRTGIRNPAAVSAHGRMAEFVFNSRQVGRPENSQKQYEPKIREFENFCELNYSHDTYKYNADNDKVLHYAIPRVWKCSD